MFGHTDTLPFFHDGIWKFRWESWETLLQRGLWRSKQSFWSVPGKILGGEAQFSHGNRFPMEQSHAGQTASWCWNSLGIDFLHRQKWLQISSMVRGGNDSYCRHHNALGKQPMQLTVRATLGSDNNVQEMLFGSVSAFPSLPGVTHMSRRLHGALQHLLYLLCCYCWLHNWHAHLCLPAGLYWSSFSFHWIAEERNQEEEESGGTDIGTSLGKDVPVMPQASQGSPMIFSAMTLLSRSPLTESQWWVPQTGPSLWWHLIYGPLFPKRLYRIRLVGMRC